MADPTVAAPLAADPTAPPTVTDAPVKFAGKFDTPAALEDGFRNLRVTRLGLDPFDDKTVLVGDKGLYANHDALAGAYKDFERVAGKLPKTEAGLGITSADQSMDPDAGIDAVLDAIGLKADDLTTQWSQDGKLTEDQYKKFAGKGLGKKAINDFMAGQQAIVAQSVQRQQAAISEAESLAGGAEKLAILRNWAGTNMPKERLANLNAMVEKDAGFYPEMVRLIADAHRAAVGAGKAQPLVSGQPGATGGVISGAKDLIATHHKALAGDASAAATLRGLKRADLDALVS